MKQSLFLIVLQILATHRLNMLNITGDFYPVKQIILHFQPKYFKL